MNIATPVILLTGFLGSGKTTLLNYILHHQKTLKIAVIENELSNTTIDQQLLSTQSVTHITNLKNGCICCNSKVELTQTLYDLLEYKHNHHLHFDYIIIECTGMADPAPIIRLLLTHELFSEALTVKGTITVIDAINAPYHFKHFNVTQSQVAMADLIFVNKTDLLDAMPNPILGSLVKQLHQMNITAPIHPIHHGEFDLHLLHQLNGFDQRNVNTHSLFSCTSMIDNAQAYDSKVNSFVIRQDKALDADKLTQLMDHILRTFPTQLIRYKGILYIQNQPNRLIIQGIQQICNSDWGAKWQDNEKTFSEIAFIGVQLPEKEFRYFFDQI